VDEPDCVDVRESLFAGRPLSAAEAEHAATCPVCSRALGAAGGAPLEPPDDLFAELAEAVRHERGFTAWLRALPTPVRLFAALDSAAVFVLAMVLARPRWAFGPVPLFRVVPVVAVLAAELGVVLWLVLRPLQAAPPNRKLVLGSIFAGLLVPVLFALVPPGARPAAAPPPPEMTTAIVACFLFGAVPGGLLVFALRALDRNAHGGTDVAVLAAVGGGLAGNAALELHCPSTAPVHLLLGHATLGIALVVLYGVIRRTARPSALVRER
jgi:hypothetical protein